MDKLKVFGYGKSILLLIAILAVITGITSYILMSNLSDNKILITKQNTFISGASGSCLINVYDYVSDKELKASLKVDLMNKDKKFVRNLYTGDTDEKGRATASFLMPQGIAGEYFLLANVISSKGKNKIYESITVKDENSSKRISINLDKPLYKAGDELNYRILITNASQDKPVKTNVTVSIFDGKRNVINKKSLVTSEYGICDGKFPLADRVNSGRFSLRVEDDVDKMSEEKSFDVKPYVLPKFKVEINSDKKEYILGESIQANIKANYFFGQPITGGKGQVKLNDG